MGATKPPLDLSFRPLSFFSMHTKAQRSVANIKGEIRKELVREALSGGDSQDIQERYWKPSLGGNYRVNLGLIHPSLMGGEYLPDHGRDAVEIARISIESVTWDVTSVYAKKGRHRIHYKVVDEYEGETLWGRSKRTSVKPLTLKQLLEFFLCAWPLETVLRRNTGRTVEAAHAFVHASSEFYPQFERAVHQQIASWYSVDVTNP